MSDAGLQSLVRCAGMMPGFEVREAVTFADGVPIIKLTLWCNGKQVTPEAETVPLCGAHQVSDYKGARQRLLYSAEKQIRNRVR